PGPVMTCTPMRHPPPVTRGRPTPRPTVAPALVIVMLIVPEVFTVNDRLLVPPGASTADQFSLVTVAVVLGDAGLLPPHADASSASATSTAAFANPETRIPNPGPITGASPAS